MVEAFAKVSEASRLLLEKGLGPATATDALGMVAQALKVDRAVLFENRTRGLNLTGRFMTDLRYGWAMPGVVSPLAHAVLRGFPLREYAPSWADTLEADMVVACPTRDAPTLMRELLERQGVQSTLLCPILPAKTWWGFIGFEDTRSPRVWRPEEVSLLKSLARAFSATVRQAQMRSSLNRVRTTLQGSVLRPLPSDS